VADPTDPVDQEQTEGHQVPRWGRAAATFRSIAIDLTPLRQSRDFRLLWWGELISTVGAQITVVALPYQVYVLTRSPLKVGLIGLVQLVPLVLVSIGAGAVADRVDRRRLILVTEVGSAATTALLLLGAIHGHPALWYVYAVAAAQSAIRALNSPARSAAIPNLVSEAQLPAAMALNQVLFNGAMVVGPAVAGLLIAHFGLAWAYGADLISFGAAILGAWWLSPMPPGRDEASRPSGWQDVKDGFAYLKGRWVLNSTFLIDLDAMIFGMPRALFPVLALTVFHKGPEALGLLYAAPAFGAVIAALTTGWVGRIRRQGLAVIWAVAAWGAAVTLFGLSGRLFLVALFFLAVAGAADVISAVFRGTILQSSVPDSLRGRLSAIHIMVVTGGPRLGDFEAGLVASLVSPWFAVVSGGMACVAGVALLATLVPDFVRYRSKAGSDGRGY